MIQPVESKYKQNKCKLMALKNSFIYQSTTISLDQCKLWLDSKQKDALLPTCNCGRVAITYSL